MEEYWAELLTEFFGSKRAGALAITGEWGSGKTYLYKNLISKIVERSGRKCLYVSLYSYGVSGKTIDDFLIEELSGVKDIDDKSKSSAGALLTGLFTTITSDTKNSGVLSAAVMAVGGAVKKRIIDALEDYVLCFDDLDRLSSDNFLKAWSEINYFSEFKLRKVILLLDETKLPQGSVHASVYEKNIWRDVPIRMSPSEALDQSLELVSSNWLDEFESIRETHLLPVVEFFRIKNIRTISTSLEPLRRIFFYKTALGGDKKINAGRLKKLCQLVFIVFLYSKLNGKKSEEAKEALRSFCNGYYSRQLNVMRQSRQSAPLKEQDSFFQSLPSLDCSNVVNCEFVYDYVLADELDIDDLRRTLVIEAEKADLSDRPVCQIYERLLDRTSMDEPEYLEFFKETLDVISQPRPGVCHIKKLANIITEFSYDSRMGGTPVEFDELILLFQNSIEQWRKFVGVDGYHFEVGLDEFLYFRKEKSDSPEVDRLLGDLDSAARAFEAERAYLDHLKGWAEDENLMVLRELSCNFDMPLFKYIDLQELEKFLASSSGKTLANFNGLITRRFSIGGSVQVILHERETLEELQKMFRNGQGHGYRRVQFTVGFQAVEEALKHIRNIAG